MEWNIDLELIILKFLLLIGEYADQRQITLVYEKGIVITKTNNDFDKITKGPILKAKVKCVTSQIHYFTLNTRP